MADFGTLTCYGLLGSDQAIFPAAQLIFRDVHVQGFSRLRYLKSLPAESAEKLYSELFEGYQSGLFETPILKTFPLEEIKKQWSSPRRAVGGQSSPYPDKVALSSHAELSAGALD